MSSQSLQKLVLSSHRFFFPPISQPLDVDDNYEDDHSISGHRVWMKKEVKKPLPDINKVKDAMDRTFKSRRKHVCTDGPSVSAIMEMYPALNHKDQVSAFFSPGSFIFAHRLNLVSFL